MSADAEKRPVTDYAEGHTRDLTVNFNLWSTLGLVYSLTATPFGVGTYLSLNLFLGGSPFYIYGYIFAVSLNIILCVCLAEMSALHPHPSGQIYWTAKFASERWARPLSYWTGVFASAAWFFWTAGTFLLVAQLLLAFITALQPSYLQEIWHTVLAAFACALASLVLNVPAFRSLPFIAKVMVIVTNCGTVLCAVALLVRANPKRSAKEVFLDITNESGWDNIGAVFFLSLLPGVTAINGFDSAAHLAEEMDDPARQVPQVMIGNTLLSGLVGLPMAIVFFFCITNPDGLVEPVGGQVVMQIFLDSLQSRGLFIVCGFLWVFVTFIASVSVTTTTSRVWWSFARQGGLPFHKWLSQVYDMSSSTVPANAVYSAVLLSCILILLYLGPTLVLNAILGTASLCFYLSYAIPIGSMLYRKHVDTLPEHYFNLGRIPGNILLCISGIWCIFISIWLVIPLMRPVDSSNMNYSTSVLACLVLIFSVHWVVSGRRHYKVPDPLII
ncbi:hypothetical protein FSARC_533 [Fusarium sarcochroum]|uniref:Amino acid transporter n=1 Tax=Fusarium sarcochroum TaxID=1208366 RepID=A0A8H4UB21_9HYPO|nr:hypothetical protein FSARC_533 [Fusarium sarcochroum]